jgi:uncharacterized lipoprotein YddW (UPF0748 family)
MRTSISPAFLLAAVLIWAAPSSGYTQSLHNVTLGAAGTMLERRAMFDEAIIWATSREATHELLNRIKAAGFNAYIPCVWHGRGTFYPSGLGRADPRLAKPVSSGEDRLAYLIQHAHSMGIQVHPWFTVALREDGQFPEYAEEGVPEGKYNIHNPEFRSFIHAVMMDVVKRYDVDGINLDYVRSGGFCLSEFCVNDYQNKFNRSLKWDLLLRKFFGDRIEGPAKWNKAAVDEIISRFTKEARLVKPNLVISVDATPMKASSELQGQDSIVWANKGWIDVIYNMDYGSKLDIHRAEKTRAALKDPSKMTMLVSLYDLAAEKKPIARDPTQLIDYIEVIKKKFPGTGIAFYHLPRLSDAQISVLKVGAFAQPAYYSQGGLPRSDQ